MPSVLGVALPDGIEWGVCVRDAATGEVLAEHEPARALPAASLGKVFLRADAGLLEGPARTLAYAVLARFDDARRDEVLGVMRALGAAMRSTAAPR